MSNPEQLADGVYFGLPEEKYFAQEALGSSDIKKLRKSASDWWWETPHNAMYDPPEESDTDAKAFGKALHKRLLEGETAFASSYYVMPEPPEGALVTVEDIRAAIRDLGHKPKGTKKADVIACAQECGVVAPILDKWQAEREEEAGGRAIISEKWSQSIALMRRVCEHHPDVSRYLFKDPGAAEVSVLWTKDGVRRRARFDRLTAPRILDAKTIGKNKVDRHANFRRACMAEIVREGYDIQSAWYMDALEAARELDMHFPPGASAEEMKNILHVLGGACAMKKPEFTFIFLQTQGAPRVLPVRIKNDSLIAVYGEQKCEEALEQFRKYRDEFGMDAFWMEVERTFSPTEVDVPSWIEAA